MSRIFKWLRIVLFTGATAFGGTDQIGPREHTLLDANWLFHRGDVPSSDAAAEVNYDDSSWQRIDVPHDYLLDGSYDKKNNNKEGYLPLVPAWYRKHFFIPQSDASKTLQLEFGGVYRDSKVWLNGHFLGRHLSGYAGFEYDITAVAHIGGENILVVSVDPREPEGHWYEGSGIYRHVYLNAMSPLHVATWGTHVVSEVPGGNEGNSAVANLTIETTVQNDGPLPANAIVISEIIGPHGGSQKLAAMPEHFSAGETRDVVQHVTVKHPRLWSVDSPQLYRLRTTLVQGTTPVDDATTTFGIRTIHFDPDKGFFLNGKRVEICGAANHQDFPAVGVAMPDSLQAWRVHKLKEMGCNGWRTAHNVPNDAVLDECDRQGLLVMEENRHIGGGYGNHTPAGVPYTNQSDLAWMIHRDRNHPSIIMWSLCNEEGLQGKKEGQPILKTMIDVVHRYDITRPITSAMQGAWQNPGFQAIEDLLGLNYHSDKYDVIHQKYPKTPIFGSETANTKSTRGEYADDPTNGWVSCYNLPDKGWLPVIERPFLAGTYMWTGFDYKGEPNPYNWPDVANNTGLMDSCGFPKDKYYYFQSCWSGKPMVHLMPSSWNWPLQEGKPIRVIAFSNAREVELFLNGKSLGTKIMPSNSHLEWEVPYAPGKLTAIARNKGHRVASDTVQTAGPAARLVLSPDRRRLKADGVDTIVVPISILDDRGRPAPDADNRVTFQLAGGGKLLGVGNGNPSDHDPDRAAQRRAFHGHCIAVIQADAKRETLELTATSPGLAPASVKFTVK